MRSPRTVPEDLPSGLSFTTSVEVRGLWSLATLQPVARPPGRDAFAVTRAFGRGAPSNVASCAMSAA